MAVGEKRDKYIWVLTIWVWGINATPRRLCSQESQPTGWEVRRTLGLWGKEILDLPLIFMGLVVEHMRIPRQREIRSALGVSSFLGGSDRKGSKRNLKKKNPEFSLTLKRFSWRRGSVIRVEFLEQGQGNEPNWFYSLGNHYNFEEASFSRIIGAWVRATQLTNVQSWPRRGRRGGCCDNISFSSSLQPFAWRVSAYYCEL